MVRTRTARFPRWIEAMGWILLPGLAYFSWLVFYQDVVLTCRYGPRIMNLWYQMSGGAKFAGWSWVISYLWLILFPLQVAVRMPRLRKRQIALFASSTLLFVLPTGIESTWTYITVHTCGLGRAGGAFLADAVRRGDNADIRYLVEGGANINYQGGCMFLASPLVEATEKGDEEVVRYLLSRGADVNLQLIGCGETALMQTAKNGNAQIVRLLLQAGANPCLKSRENETAQESAQRAGYGELKELFSHPRPCP